MTFIRVAVTELSNVVAGVVRAALSGEPGIEVVAAVDGPHDSSLVAEARPDVVVVGAGAADGARAGLAALGLDPTPRVIVLEAEGRDTVLCELRPHLKRLGALGPDQLAGWVRTAQPATSREPAWIS